MASSNFGVTRSQQSDTIYWIETPKRRLQPVSRTLAASLPHAAKGLQSPGFDQTAAFSARIAAFRWQLGVKGIEVSSEKLGFVKRPQSGTPDLVTVNHRYSWTIERESSIALSPQVNLPTNLSQSKTRTCSEFHNLLIRSAFVATLQKILCCPLASSSAV